jgi:DNA-binding MarR family transcriptional regulator
VLRLLDADVTEINEIAEILGLDPIVVDQAVKKLEDKGHLTILHSNAETKIVRRAQLTDSGRKFLNGLERQIPQEENFYFRFDALTGEYLPDEGLSYFMGKPKRAQHKILPVDGVSPPREIDKLPYEQIKRFWRKNEAIWSKKGLIKILDISKEPCLVYRRRLQLLQFSRASDDDILVQVYDGHERLSNYEEALKKKKEELRALRAEKKNNSSEQNAEEVSKIIRILSTREHRSELFKALQKAKRYVIIVSPWLESAVDDEFCEKIKLALQRGVQLKIGYGYEVQVPKEEDKKRTKEALRKLKELKTEGDLYLQVFKFEQDVHSKVVLWDDEHIITTSFNWLSSKGEASGGRSRIEFGVLIHDSRSAEDMLVLLDKIFHNARRKI